MEPLPPAHPRQGTAGTITGQWSTGSCGGCVRAPRGGICRSGMGTGRPSTGGIGAGRRMARGPGSLMRCASTPTPGKVHSGQLGWILPVCECTSMPPGHGENLRRKQAAKGGAESGGFGWAGSDREVPRRVDHENPPGHRSALPPGAPPHHAGSARRLPRVRNGHRRHPHPPINPRPTTHPARPGAGGQGVLLPTDP